MGKMVAMSALAEEILDVALKLPDADRATLAARLIESLDEEEIEDGRDDAWAIEIQRRLDEIRSGAVRTVPWATARKMILGLKDETSSR